MTSTNDKIDQSGADERMSGIGQIRKEHQSAKPQMSNPAWVFAHNNVGYLLEYVDILKSDIAALQAQTAQAVDSIPDGWKLVPIVPTDEMVEAAWESDAADYVGEHKIIFNVSDAYTAMLTAVPQQAVSASSQSKEFDNLSLHKVLVENDISIFGEKEWMVEVPIAKLCDVINKLLATNQPVQAKALTDEQIGMREVANALKIHAEQCRSSLDPNVIINMIDAAEIILAASQTSAQADVAAVRDAWQPIESAPFQVDLLVLGQDGIVRQGYRATQYKNDWTHWMPLPAAPTAQPQADGVKP